MSEIINNDGCSLVVLPNSGIEILRVLCKYAERRINYQDTALEHGWYTQPNDADWDEILSIVHETEDGLMNTCDLQDLLDSLECICPLLQTIANNSGGPDWGWSVNYETTFPTIQPAIPETPQADDDACALAQLSWQGLYEMFTETILPGIEFGFDYLAPAAAAIIIGWAGGPVAVAGVYICAEFIQELLELGFEAAEESDITWLINNKQEIICEAYFGWLETGQAGAKAALEAYIDSATEEVSPGDRILLKFALALALPACAPAWAAESEWAMATVESGACDGCEDVYDRVWHGIPCPWDPPESEEIDGVSCYGTPAAVLLDVAKPAFTVGADWAIQTGQIKVGLWASGAAGYGGNVRVQLKDHLDNLMDETTFEITTSESTQYHSAILNCVADSSAYFYLFAEGSGVARVIAVGASQV